MLPLKVTVSSITSLMENMAISELQHLLSEFMRDLTYNFRGRYHYYVVYCGRTTGVFDNWYDVYVLCPEDGNN